jgi:hypothetical protein
MEGGEKERRRTGIDSKEGSDCEVPSIGDSLISDCCTRVGSQRYDDSSVSSIGFVNCFEAVTLVRDRIGNGTRTRAELWIIFRKSSFLEIRNPMTV